MEYKIKEIEELVKDGTAGCDHYGICQNRENLYKALEVIREQQKQLDRVREALIRLVELNKWVSGFEGEIGRDKIYNAWRLAEQALNETTNKDNVWQTKN